MKKMNILSFKYLINLLLLCFFTANLELNAQNSLAEKLITLSEQESDLRAVINKISSQSNVFFIYDDTHIDNKQISCVYNAEPTSKVVSNIAKQVDLSYKRINNNTFVLYKNNERIKLFNSNLIGDAIRGKNGIISPPKRKYNQLPDYPPTAKQNNIEGSVKLNLYINRSGIVERVILMKSSGHEILDKTAMNYSKEILFKPAKKGNITISAWYEMNFNYQLFRDGFSPNDYVNEIQDYYSQLRNHSQEKYENLHKKILNTHIRYLSKFNDDESNINYYIDKIISSSLKNKWSNFWDDKSLIFLVFHDFIQHSHYEELNTKAKSYLIKFMTKEIEDDKETSPQKQELFQKKVYTLLEQEYPELLNNIFRGEVKAK